MRSPDYQQGEAELPTTPLPPLTSTLSPSGCFHTSTASVVVKIEVEVDSNSLEEVVLQRYETHFNYDLNVVQFT